MTMMFAGLTSAVVKSRVDWLTDFELPTAFYYSTIVIIGCSITFHFKPFKKDNKSATTTFFCYFSIGILFVILQFMGFGQIVQDGYYFTGRRVRLQLPFFMCDRSALNSPCWWVNFIADYNL
jgi:cytochrome c oxidase subunit 3